jgi:LuxR family maltose regulon positive regulatory protein
MAKSAEPPARGANPLTPREREILSLIAQGESNRQISAHLVISLSTVKTHINNIYRKLNADNRGGALAEGYRLGLL